MEHHSSSLGHPVGALLPQFTFITGPNGVGKTTLGSQLFMNINGLQLFSFAEPLRQALVGMFYQGDITIDLTQPHYKALPVPGFPLRTHREALNALGDWFRNYFGPNAIGEHALHKCQIDADYFERFVFDDARCATDITAIINEFGKENCLLIDLSRPGVTFSQPHHFKHELEEMKVACPNYLELVNDAGIGDLLHKLQTTIEVEALIRNSGVPISEL